MLQSKMLAEARQTNRGHKFWLEIPKSAAVVLSISFVAQILSAVLVVLLGFHDNESITNLLFLWGQLFGIGLIILYCCVIEKRPISSLGFRKGHIFGHYLGGLAIGCGLFLSVIVIGKLLGSFKFVGVGKQINPLQLCLFLVGFLIQGMCEELLFRGYILVSLARKNHIWLAIIFNAVFFALMHIGNSGFNVLAFVNMMLLSVYLSLYTLKTDDIWGAGAIHGIWNFVQGCVFGLNVSGVTLTNPIFIIEPTEKVLENGGKFGPEGGFLVTIVLSVELLSFILTKIIKKRK